MRKLIAPFTALLVALAALLAVGAPAEAQVSSAVVVSTCGTPPATYPPGANRQVTQDTNGNLCSNANVSVGTVNVTGAVTTSAPTYMTGTNQPVSLTTSGGLRSTLINGSGTVLPFTFDGSNNLNVNVQTGTITANNASVSATGAAVPGSATYLGAINGGNLIGVAADSSGRLDIVGAGVAGTPAGGVVSIQGVASGTAVPVSGTVTATVGSVQSYGLGVVPGSKIDLIGGSNGAGANTYPMNVDSLGDVVVVGSYNVGSTAGSIIGPLAGLTYNSTQTAVSTGQAQSGQSDAVGNQKVVLCNPGATTPLCATVTASNAVKVDGSAVTQPVSGTVTLGAGSALAGKVGIDQTTLASTNGVDPVPCSTAACGIAPGQSSSVEACHVFKNSAGNLYGFVVQTDGSAATNDRIQIFDATSAPADGAVTPVAWGGVISANQQLSWASPNGIPMHFANGIVGCLSSNASPFSKTADAHGAWSWMVQ